MRMLVVAVIAMVLPVYTRAGESGGSGTPDTSDAYRFPIVAGAPEWRGIPGMQGTLEACQIPEEILGGMSTKGLVETCLNYPRRHYWQVSSLTVLPAIRAVIKGFNGLQELMLREDAGSALLNAYRRMDPEQIGPPPWNQEERTLIADFAYVELILCQEEVLAPMALEERHSLLKTCSRNYEVRSVGGNTLSATAELLMGRVLLSLGYEPFMQDYSDGEALEPFLEYGLSVAPLEGIAEAIHRHAKHCIATQGGRGGR